MAENDNFMDKPNVLVLGGEWLFTYLLYFVDKSQACRCDFL